MQRNVAIFGGTVVIINAADMEFEAGTLIKLLEENSVKTTSMQHITEAMLIPGQPYVRIYEEIVLSAKHFIVIPSAGLRQDNKLKELVYIALGVAGFDKRVIPIKFSPEDSGMPFLENLHPARFHTALLGEDREKYIRHQVAKLLEVL